MFQVKGIHHSISSDQFQFNVNCYGHADSYFHSEQGEESMFDFYMHCEDNNSSFFWPNELIESVDVLGKTNWNKNFSLPQENVNENQVYERGKKF